MCLISRPCLITRNAFFSLTASWSWITPHCGALVQTLLPEVTHDMRWEFIPCGKILLKWNITLCLTSRVLHRCEKMFLCQSVFFKWWLMPSVVCIGQTGRERCYQPPSLHGSLSVLWTYFQYCLPTENTFSKPYSVLLRARENSENSEASRTHRAHA